MFKYNGKSLKEEIVIKEFLEKNINEKELEPIKVWNFMISTKDKDKEYGFDFFIINKEQLLKLPLNKRTNINEYVSKDDAYWNLGINKGYKEYEKNYEDIEFSYIDFFLTKLSAEDFLMEIIVHYEYQHFKSLEIDNYDIEVSFKFNYNKDIVLEKEKNA